MYFTVHDLVTKNIFPDLRIAAGIGGIDNKITSLNSTDILHDPGCFQAGELIFTTGYDFLDELKYTRFLPELHLADRLKGYNQHRKAWLLHYCL